jgi:ABC-type Fe3+ transport system permease subunit
MRKTEFILGLCAGIAGLLLAALSFFSLLPRSALFTYAENTFKIYAVVCIAANALGIVGALLVQKHNIPGAVIMAVSMIAVLIFGFPWQSLPAVLYIISGVMATVPVKTAANID